MTRPCAICGKQVNAGMTDNAGSFYVHEDCFEEFMNNTFGIHGWMMLGGEATDDFGGYYLVTDWDEKSGFRGTGIYYTEWEEDDEDDK